MRRMKASEIFKTVDPGLKVIDGGNYRKKKYPIASTPSTSLTSSTPSTSTPSIPITETDWLAAHGAICSRCNCETFWISNPNKLCKRCSARKDICDQRAQKKKDKYEQWRLAHNRKIDRNRKR